jgi:hypothetical protein
MTTSHVLVQQCLGSHVTSISWSLYPSVADDPESRAGAAVSRQSRDIHQLIPVSLCCRWPRVTCWCSSVEGGAPSWSPPACPAGRAPGASQSCWASAASRKVRRVWIAEWKKVYSKCAINFHRPHLNWWHNWQLKNKEALYTFKGLSGYGGRPDFLKKPPRHFL